MPSHVLHDPVGISYPGFAVLFNDELFPFLAEHAFPLLNHVKTLCYWLVAKTEVGESLEDTSTIL